MFLSVFDLFKIGIGPSSSHTVGPMVAARRFLDSLTENQGRIRVTLHGSLAFTGKGHGTDRAIVLGLAGETPQDIDPEKIDTCWPGWLSRKKRGRSISILPAT
jgi:L-serine dehydratase